MISDRHGIRMISFQSTFIIIEWEPSVFIHVYFHFSSASFPFWRLFSSSFSVHLICTTSTCAHIKLWSASAKTLYACQTLLHCSRFASKKWFMLLKIKKKCWIVRFFLRSIFLHYESFIDYLSLYHSMHRVICNFVCDILFMRNVFTRIVCIFTLGMYFCYNWCNIIDLQASISSLVFLCVISSHWFHVLIGTSYKSSFYRNKICFQVRIVADLG